MRDILKESGWGSVTRPRDETMSEIVLEVPDISCEHCARAINRRLAPLAGVRRIEVDVPGKRVRVEYDETQADLGAVREALADEGYAVSER